MDIYSKPGTKVKCIHLNENNWSFNDKENLHLLEIGKEYMVEKTEVHGWYTKVFLGEFPGIEFHGTRFEQQPGRVWRFEYGKRKCGSRLLGQCKKSHDLGQPAFSFAGQLPDFLFLDLEV